ncbi:hypothetical protein ckin120_01970 [Helicobacter pylori]
MGFRLNRAILWYNSQHVFFKRHLKTLQTINIKPRTNGLNKDNVSLKHAKISKKRSKHEADHNHDSANSDRNTTTLNTNP